MEKSYMMKKAGKVMFFVLLAPVLAYAFIHLVMYLWNGILPDVFGFSTITFWQAAGMLLLSKILFGGMNFGKKGCCHGKGRFGSRMKDKFMNMSEEEKEKMKKEWKTRCC
jgi:hypothetical protein